MELRLTNRIDRIVGRLGTLVVIVAGLLFTALHYIPAAHGSERPFDWDRYHERQDACREQNRIAAACVVQGYCDDLALRQAQRSCSAFGPLGQRPR